MALNKAVLVVLFFSFGSHASIRKLVREYLETNMSIKSNELDSESVGYNINLTQAQNDWFLNSTLSYTDQEGVGFFAFNQNNTITKYGSLGISKDNFWGGEFSLKQELYKSDLRQWAAPPNGETNYYETITTLNYTQDLGSNFFGLKYRTEVDIAESTAKKAQIELSSANQNLLFSFYTNYLNTKLDKTLVALNEEALKRAKKRRSVIAKRVQDRLSKTVDLYQAQIAELTQEETLRSRKRSFYENLNNLNLGLHRQIREIELNEFDLNSPIVSKRIEGELDNNMDLKALAESLQVARLTLKKAKRGYYPTIALTGSYSTDSLLPNFNEAYKQGSFGSGPETASVALSISLPLGMEQASAEVAQSKLSLRKNELMIRKMRIDLDNTIYSLERRISSLEEEIGLSKKKMSLAQKALKEQNRLYYLGKRDLDEVIRSEETLISTEVSLVNNLTIYNILLGQYASVKGKLLSFTYQFID